MRFFVKTFGCQMNVSDSDFISSCLINFGFSPTENLDEAGLIVVNTCTVRQHAEDKALSFIGRLKRYKTRNAGCKIIVAGCVASRLGKTLKKRFPFIDEIIPATCIEKFPEIIKSILNSSDRSHNFTIPQFQKSEKHFPDITTANHPIIQTFDFSNFIPISRGCSNYCSYCIVPFVRGELKHRPVEEILSDIKQMIMLGKSEITLIAQNVNSYNSPPSTVNGPQSTVNGTQLLVLRAQKNQDQAVTHEEQTNIDFADLLEIVSRIDGVKKIKFLTNHPKDMSDKIIDTVARNDRVEKFFHLPVQSGSDRILKLMNRNYTKDYYLNLLKKIRTAIPTAIITTDIIVGFPTETEKDFQETVSLIKEAKFNSLFAFKYSPREMTAAFKLSDDVPMHIKEKRLATILKMIPAKVKD